MTLPVSAGTGCHQSCFNEGRLVPLNGLERQNIQGPAPISGAGLWFVPVVHEGNQSYSAEEVDRVAAITEILTQAGSTWTDRGGNQRPLTIDDILIVAPYNNQVNRLTDRKQNRTQEAKQAYEEALQIFREFAQKNPEAYLPDVATTLNDLGVLDRDQMRMEEA